VFTVRAVDHIVKYIEEQGMTQDEAAAVVGCSRQCLWDKLNKGSARFHNMISIFAAFGFSLNIIHEDATPAEFDIEKFITTASRGRNMYFDDLENMINAMGYRFELVKRECR
jgi:hypothetical protein